MSNERGVSAQELPENQDPGVQFTVDEASGKHIPWKKAAPVEEAPKRRGRPKKEEVSDDVPAEGEGE